MEGGEKKRGEEMMILYGEEWDITVFVTEVTTALWVGH